MKRLLFIMLSLAVISVPLIAGGQDEAAQDEVIITILGQIGGEPMTKGVHNDLVMEEFTKRTGVTLDFTPTIQNIDFQAVLPVMLASGDLPDIIMEGSVELRTKILTAKAAIPLDDLIETNGQDLKMNSPLALKMSKTYRSDSTGSLYFIPGAPATGRSPYSSEKGLQVRWDLFAELGYPELRSLDDLLKMGEDMVKLEPKNADGKQNYALGWFAAENWGWIMPEQFVQLAGIAALGTGPIFVDTHTDTPIPRITAENNYFWEVVKMWNTGYQNGLVDPETPTLNFGQYFDKIKTGRYMILPLPWGSGANTAFVDDGMPEKGFGLIKAQIDEQNMIAWTTSKTGNHIEMSITTACKNPESAMDAINYMATPEGVSLFVNGVMGSGYDIVDGVPVVKQEVLDNNTQYMDRAGIGRYNALVRAEIINHPAGFPMVFRNLPQAVQSSLLPIQRDMMEYYRLEVPSEVYDYIPNNTVEAGFLLGMKSPEPGSELARIESRVVPYIQTAITRIIFQKTDSEYDRERRKVISELKSMGIEKLEAHYTEQYKSMKAAVGEL